MKDTTYRLVYVSLGLAAMVVVGLAIMFAPSGSQADLPDPVERIFPLPNDAVIRQTTLEVDMAAGYQMVLFVDGIRISPVEIGIQTGTNLHTWQPAPGRFLETWAPGTHTIRIEWERTGGLPEPGSYAWSFRVQ